MDKEEDVKRYRDAQHDLLASLIFDGSQAVRVFEILQVEDFRDPQFFLIAVAIANIARRDQTVSQVSIATELDSMGKLEVSGGTSQIFDMKIAGEKALLNGTHEMYARIVKESSAKSQVSELLDSSKDHFKNDSGVNALDGVSGIQSALGDIVLGLSDDSNRVEVSKYVGGFMDMLDERKALGEENASKGIDLQGIPTMLPSLNEYTGGWMGGQVVTIGAGTGVGKSVFAIMSAVAAARAGKTVLFFSLEMSADDLINRVMALMSGVPINKLKTGRVNDEERERIIKATKDLEGMNLIIDEDPGASIDSIRSKAISQSQSEEGLDMIIVDYLQLLSGPSKNNRQEFIAELSRNSKLIAKVLDVVFMNLVQLKRGDDKDEEDRLPQIKDIRESGAIAQDSDIVILLHRELSHDGSIPQTWVILAKQRSGPANKIIRCHSNLANSNFAEIRSNPDLSDENIGDLGDDDLDLSTKSDEAFLKLANVSFDNIGEMGESLLNDFSEAELDEVDFDDLDF